MLTTLLDFFCSRPFPDMPSWRKQLLWALQALAWGIIAALVGWHFAGDFALPGEHVQTLAAFSGASAVDRSAYPLLWQAVSLFLGESPSMLALNGLGTCVMGVLVACTWQLVRFWVHDAMNEDSVAGPSAWLPCVTAHVACAVLLFSLPGLYAASGLMVGTWSLAWLLLCVMLQNRYAMGGGHRHAMALFALVLGGAVVESPWVLLCLPLFFLRALAIEWRLWDHSARNLPLWFIALVASVVGMLIWNTLRTCEALTLNGVVQTELAVLRVHMAVLSGMIVGHPWLFIVAGGVLWPLLAWITARQLLNNGRAWGLLFTAVVLSFAGFGLFWGLGGKLPLPIFYWLAQGQVPLATAWVTSVAGVMLLAGWGIQLFAKNPNIYEEHDRRHIPAHVTAMRVGAIFLLPISALVAAITLGVQTRRFAALDRGMTQRFAAEAVASLAAEPQQPTSGHVFVLGASWIDNHLLLEAQRRGQPITLFSINRAQDKPYLEDLRQRLQSDPLLGDADRLRLTHLLDYNFLTFVQDFFVSQYNAAEIAAAYDLADVWYAAKLRPIPYGTLYLGAPMEGGAAADPLPANLALRQAWQECLAIEALPWYDLSASTHSAIRHHIAFVSNNLGTYLDDQQRAEEAADCYFYAWKTDKSNISALLNLYDITLRRGQLPERRVEINKAFQDFITARAKSARKYDLSAVGRYYGYIRNYDLFVQMGWEWAVSSAPESVLAGLRNAQNGLAPTDPRNGAVRAVVAAVYELQGQTERSIENYHAAVQINPKNVEALRGLARLAIQQGKTAEAGQWLAKAEEAGADQESLDIDRTAYLMAMGDLEGASRAIGRYTTNHKDSAVGWAMLGMLEIEKGKPDNISRASGFILQNIRRTAQGRDLYFQHVLEGRLAQFHAQESEALSHDATRIPSEVARQDAAKRAIQQWEDARRQYRRAYAIRPNVRGLLELILEFDRRLGDRPAAEADALAILREDTRHPYANFIVGSQRLEDGEVEAATKYFRVAVEGTEEPSASLLNNYAEALIRVGQSAKAKEVALRCIQLDAKNYASWATYALTLARGDEAAKAKTAIDKARELAAEAKIQPDPRIGLVDIYLALNAGDKMAAQQALAQLKNTLGAQLTPCDTRDLKEIEAALAR